jgi:hypothetical protein
VVAQHLFTFDNYTIEKIEISKDQLKQALSKVPVDSVSVCIAHFKIGIHYEQKKNWAKANAHFRECRDFARAIALDSMDLNIIQIKLNQISRRRNFGQPHLDIDSSPEISVHLGKRNFSFPQGELGVYVNSVNDEKKLYTKNFNSSNEAYFIDFNLIGISDNYIFAPFRNTFSENTYGFFSIRPGFTLMPSNVQEQGFTFMADMGVDGGLTHVLNKRLSFTFGLKVIPLGMTYTFFDEFIIDHLMPNGLQESLNVTMAQNQFFVAGSPFIKGSVFLTKAISKPLVALDFTLGWHFTHTYGRWVLNSLNSDELNLSPNDFVMSSEMVKNNTFSLNGRFLSVGLRWIL